MFAFFIVIGVLCLAYLILIFLTSPSGKIHTDLEWLGGKMIAHRGLHSKENGIPENSLPAFAAAVDRGYPIEIDLHLTKDGKVVVFHDGSTDRMCQARGTVEEMTLAELKSLFLLETDCKIPTLAECLALVDGKVPLLIEFKVGKKNAAALCSAAEALLGEYRGPYLIQSFYPQVLLWYRRHRKDVCRGQLATAFQKEGFSKMLLGNMLLNFIGRPHFISYRHPFAKKPMFRFAVWQGAYPIGWTFRSADELREHKADFKCWIFENFTPDA